MPVSLERLIAEVEPNVITEQLTRECVQITGADPDAVEEKRLTMHFREIETLAFGFKSIACVNNLNGLDNLTKLQLDNNEISRIENVGHLVNLTWLDLSFNKIEKIEGLEPLKKLVDLSLFNNKISDIENLDGQVKLNVLSLGNNTIKKLEAVMYLRQFKALRLVNLAGNPICKDHDYRSYVLSHIRDLTYLDYRRVSPADVGTAMEQHQDEMIEITEREEQAGLEEKAASERATHQALMSEANLDGVESIAEDMVREDPEWGLLASVPGLTDGWNDIRDKLTAACEDFKAVVLEQHGRKKSEYQEWLGVVKGALAEKDSSAQELIVDFEKLKKRTTRAIQDNANNADTLVLAPKVRLMALQEQLMEIEMEAVEVLADLLTEFDRNYSELAEANKGNYNAYFTQVRDLQNYYFNSVSVLASSLHEKYNNENSDIDNLTDEGRVLLQDKDTLMNALQASHDAHTGRIDGLEDRLISAELRNANDLAASNAIWAARRNRDRISEIINYVERNMIELDELAGDDGEADS